MLGDQNFAADGSFHACAYQASEEFQAYHALIRLTQRDLNGCGSPLVLFGGTQPTTSHRARLDNVNRRSMQNNEYNEYNRNNGYNVDNII